MSTMCGNLRTYTPWHAINEVINGCPGNFMPCRMHLGTQIIKIGCWWLPVQLPTNDVPDAQWETGEVAVPGSTFRLCRLLTVAWATCSLASWWKTASGTLWRIGTPLVPRPNQCKAELLLYLKWRQEGSGLPYIMQSHIIIRGVGLLLRPLHGIAYMVLHGIYYKMFEIVLLVPTPNGLVSLSVRTKPVFAHI